MKQLDIVFVNYNAPEIVYQELANRWTAIEPPSWSLMLANACRSAGFGSFILDGDAEKLTHQECIDKIHHLNPRLVAFPVYGQNPQSSAAHMEGNTQLAIKLKAQYPQYKICFLGTYTQGMPMEVLQSDYTDLICFNEGVRALKWLLATDLKTDLHTIKGLGWKDKDGRPTLNDGVGSLVPNGNLDEEIPRGGYDLLPYKNKPLDLYRAHWWHAEFKEENTNPFLAVYSSLGCSFRCFFCSINGINREDTSDTYTAAQSNIMRYWSTNAILDDFEEIAKLGVKTLRISDELLYYRKAHYEPLLRGILERGLNFKFWIYSKVHTVVDRFLELFKQAGCNYIALGIESGDYKVRQEVEKGSFKELDIREVVKKIEAAGINVIQNYIVGLPTDDEASVQKSYDLATEMNCAFLNIYPAMALPPSPLWYDAKQKGYELPKKFSEWSFLSYDSLPLRTEKLASADILRLRDKFWVDYMKRSEYLQSIQAKFGVEAKNNLVEMSKVKLRRRLLET
jgi:radical SAM superfamily enzyme YgiQ (UPF0313 family)